MPFGARLPDFSLGFSGRSICIAPAADRELLGLYFDEGLTPRRYGRGQSCLHAAAVPVRVWAAPGVEGGRAFAWWHPRIEAVRCRGRR